MSDCIWHGGGHQPEHGVQAICELITDLIPRLGFNPATDVQVLCPMTRGVVGTRNLNTVLQQLINPPSPDKVEINRGGNQYFSVKGKRGRGKGKEKTFNPYPLPFSPNPILS